MGSLARIQTYLTFDLPCYSNSARDWMVVTVINIPKIFIMSTCTQYSVLSDY